MEPAVFLCYMYQCVKLHKLMLVSTKGSINNTYRCKDKPEISKIFQKCLILNSVLNTILIEYKNPAKEQFPCLCVITAESIAA